MAEGRARCAPAAATSSTFRSAARCFLTPPGDVSDLLPRAIGEVTGLTPDLSTTGGTSDARFIHAYCPVAEFGLVGQTMHKVDERVTVADIAALTKIYRAVLEHYFTKN